MIMFACHKKVPGEDRDGGYDENFERYICIRILLLLLFLQELEKAFLRMQWKLKEKAKAKTIPCGKDAAGDFLCRSTGGES